MCIILHIPLQDIYTLSDEDMAGLIEENNNMVNETSHNNTSGKSHTRRATAKEMKIFKK